MMYCTVCGGTCDELMLRGNDLKPDCWVWRTALWFWQEPASRIARRIRWT
jgi:hypothetical protein